MIINGQPLSIHTLELVTNEAIWVPSVPVRIYAMSAFYGEGAPVGSFDYIVSFGPPLLGIGANGGDLYFRIGFSDGAFDIYKLFAPNYIETQYVRFNGTGPVFSSISLTMFYTAAKDEQGAIA